MPCFYKYFIAFIYCGGGVMHVPLCECGGWRTNYRCQFFPSTAWSVGVNSEHQAWCQVPLPAVPSPQLPLPPAFEKVKTISTITKR